MSVTVSDRVTIPLKNVMSPVEFITFNGLEQQHFALFFHGVTPNPRNTPLVRIHSECMTGDTFGSLLCDCGPQLEEAKQKMDQEGGYILYMRQEGRGIGLYAKLKAYQLQQLGLDTFAANRELNLPEDGRSFVPAADMLKALKLLKIRLLSNNPDKQQQIEQQGIEVSERISTTTFANPHNQAYLHAKQQLKQHSLDIKKH